MATLLALRVQRLMTKEVGLPLRLVPSEFFWQASGHAVDCVEVDPLDNIELIEQQTLYITDQRDALLAHAAAASGDEATFLNETLQMIDQIAQLLSARRGMAHDWPAVRRRGSPTRTPYHRRHHWQLKETEDAAWADVRAWESEQGQGA